MSITHVQTVLVAQTDYASNAAFASITVTAGNLIRVRTSTYSGDIAAGGVTDSLGNTYTKAISQDTVSPSGKWAAEWYTVSASSGANVITVDRNAGGGGVHQVSGAASEYSATYGWPADPLHFADSTYNSDSDPTSPNVVVSIDTPVLMGASITDWNSDDPYTAPGGSWTNRQSEQGVGTHNAFFTEDQIVSASGSYSATWGAAGTIPRAIIVTAYEAAVPNEGAGVVAYSYAVTGTGDVEAGGAPPVDAPASGAYVAYSQALQRQIAEWTAKQSPQVERKRKKRKAAKAANPTFEVFVPEATVGPFPERKIASPPQVRRGSGVGRVVGPSARVRGSGFRNKWSLEDDAAAVLMLMNAAT